MFLDSLQRLHEFIDPSELRLPSSTTSYEETTRVSDGPLHVHTTDCKVDQRYVVCRCSVLPANCHHVLFPLQSRCFLCDQRVTISVWNVFFYLHRFARRRSKWLWVRECVFSANLFQLLTATTSPNWKRLHKWFWQARTARLSRLSSLFIGNSPRWEHIVIQNHRWYANNEVHQ